MDGARPTRSCARGHRWDVPERYNIAADVCDKHPRDKPAMVWESFDGSLRELDWGELQDLANQAAHTLAARGVGARRPRRGRAAADARDGGDLLRRLEARRDPALDVGALRRRRRSSTGSRTRRRGCSSPTPRTRRGSTGRGRRTCSCSSADTLAAAPTDFVCADTAADDPAQLYYTSGTTGLAKGIVHAHRYILAHEEFVYCHEVRGRRALPRDGRVGLGGGDRAAARPVAARRRAVRLPARGRLRPAQAARLPQPPRGDERLHDADRDALDDGDRGRGDALSAARSAASARPASRSTPRRSAGSASSTASPCSTTTG